MRRVRRVVTAALEVERREKVIGASLEAAPVVHVADGATRNALAEVAFDDICIVSDIEVVEDPAPDDAFRLDDVPGVAVSSPAPRARSACAAGRSCPTWARTPIRASAPAATTRWIEPVPSGAARARPSAG